MNTSEHALDTAERELNQRWETETADEPDEVVIGKLTVINGQRRFIYLVTQDGNSIPNELSREEAIEFLNTQSAADSLP
jgi:hypothetical protein